MIKENGSSVYKTKIIILTILIILILLFLLNIFVYFPKLILLLLTFGLTIILKKHRQFLKDWLLFLSIIYLSDTLRGVIYYLICKFQLPVYCLYVIKLEKALFGTIPSVLLQNLLLKGQEIGYLEKFLTVLHGTHFIAFLIVGFYFWMKNARLFQLYKYSFYLLLIFGLSGYLFIPTAPPWMTSELFRVIPRLFHFNLHLYNMYIPDLTSGFNTDPVAAMPSLHAAFPFLCSLLLWKYLRGKGWIFYLYTFLILFTIVYTGDHYIVDLIAGITLAFLSLILGGLIQHKLKKQPLSPSSPQPLRHSRLSILFAVIIIIFSLSIGNSIKKPLQQYYQDFTIINFIDFTSYPNKINNFAAYLYLGDHYVHHEKFNQAYSYYQKAAQLARTTPDKKLVQQKINFLQFRLKRKKF